MGFPALALSEHLGGVMLVGAAIAFYIASRAASDAMSHAGTTSALRHALAQWGGIAAVCVVAVWLDHAEIAVGVIFSTSVAALSLHLGVAIATNPQPAHARPQGHGFDVVEPHPARSDLTHAGDDHAGRSGALRGRRAWAMVLPVGVLALMVGFSGKLTLLHALLFAIQGVFVMMVWKERSDVPRGASSAERLSGSRRAQIVLALALAVIGAFCAIHGAVRMSDETGIMSTGLIASAALGPLLVLPMIGSASLMASHGQVQTVAGASVVMVLLNLCLLLPLVIVGWHARVYFVVPANGATEAIAAPPSQPSTAATAPATTRPSTQSSTNPADDDEGESFVEEESAPDDMPRVLGFPIAVWRIDTVLLVLLGLVLLPVALNLWDLRRSEGILLVAIYAAYLITTTFLGRRW